MKNISILFLFSTFALCPLRISAIALDDHLWESRIVITLTNQGQTLSDLRTELMENKDAIAERKLIVYVIYTNKVWAFPYGQDNNSTVTELAARLGTANSLLIGLDGGNKQIYSQFSLSDVFRDIDGMPMRRAEINYNRDN